MIAFSHVTHAMFGNELIEPHFEGNNKTMVNHVKSDKLKRQVARKVKENLMVQALALYQTERSKPFRGKSASLRKVCKMISDDYYLRTRKRINLDHNTLARRAKGGMILTDYNGKKS